ncbi:MAG: SprT family zinc-dependent metalloprotease [Dysgonamonadaceae bacterium]|nr:SprT family zinc-dependent metalloprotease [Dysgonamonadaceae bacterium]
MSTNSYLQLGTVEALVVRKPIKNLHLSVLPPNGWVRISAPERMKDNAIRTLIALRLPWIKKQQAKFTGQERQTKRDYVSGESHYLFGKRYRLELVYKNEVPAVILKGKNKLILRVRPKSPISKRREVMLDWYRQELHKVVDGLIVKWQKKIGVQAKFWAIKRMKTRWGTCNHKRGRILINLELAKKPVACIEYVVVHELLHLIEKKHDDKFVALMTRYLPKWKSTKEELNRFILSYEEWKY